MMQLRLRIWGEMWESLKEWWEGWWGEKQAEPLLDLEAALASPGSPATSA